MTCARCGDPVYLAFRCGHQWCPTSPPCPTRWLHEPLVTERAGVKTATMRREYDHRPVPA